LKTATAPQLIGVQYLRAIAALMVAYFHSLIQFPEYRPFLSRYLFADAHLANGVDLFFVISGFIMLVSSRRALPGDFFVRRIIRIVPLYWTLTTVLALILLWHPALFRSTVMGTGYFAKSLLFVPYANPGQHGEMFPLLVPGWSLNFEMFFYAIFACALFAPLNRRVVLTGAIFTILVGLGYLLRNAAFGAEINFFTDIRLFEFLFGMAIAHFYIAGRLRFPAGMSLVFVLGGFLALLAGFPMLHLARGSTLQVLLENELPAAALVLGIVSLEAKRGLLKLPFLAFLGDASYSMYLSHIFSLGAASKLWLMAGLMRPTASSALEFVFFALVFVVIGSILTYRVLEQPMLLGLHRLYAPRRTAVPQHPALLRADPAG
jgi:exopolysaccharide production protein ExoZ